MLSPLEKCKPLLAYPQHLNSICQHFESQPLLCLSQTKVICVVLCSIMTVSLTAFPTFGTHYTSHVVSPVALYCRSSVTSMWLLTGLLEDFSIRYILLQRGSSKNTFHQPAVLPLSCPQSSSTARLQIHLA